MLRHVVTIPKSQASKKMIDYLTLGLNCDFPDIALAVDSSADYEISIVDDGDYIPLNTVTKMRRAVSAFFKEAK